MYFKELSVTEKGILDKDIIEHLNEGMLPVGYWDPEVGYECISDVVYEPADKDSCVKAMLCILDSWYAMCSAIGREHAAMIYYLIENGIAVEFERYEYIRRHIHIDPSYLYEKDRMKLNEELDAILASPFDTRNG